MYIESGLTTILVIIIIFDFFALILFFKIWEMTNDVSEIKEFLKTMTKIKEYDFRNKQTIKTTSKQNRPKNDIKLQSDKFELYSREIEDEIELFSWVVAIESMEEFQVIEILDENTFLCVNAKNQDGIKFKKSEIKKA